MGHKNLIDSVGRDTTGGRCLVDGVGYSIKKGRTLVAGVGYDVTFGGSPVSVTITGSGSSYASTTINGTKYSSAASGIEVLPGDTIVFTVSGGGAGRYGTIKIDGTTVLSTGATNQTYSWVVPDGVGIVTITLSYSSTGRIGTITVTTS